ncbi:MAG: hypothetical protein AAGD07_26090, partial [Planctomycetota bacterium]
SLAGLVLYGCFETGPPPPPMISQQGWTVADKPQLPAGRLKDRALWNDPSVVKVGDQYRLYMTTSTGEPFKPPVLPFLATSSDGKSWSLASAKPLLTPEGGPYVSVETPSVVRFRGEWHMFFTGIYGNPDPTPMAIGHALSSNGRDWQVREWTVLRATGTATDWNSYLVGEPGAVVVGNQLHVYFSAVGAREGGGPPLQSIGLITSADGRSFDEPRLVLGQGPNYPASKGFAGYSSPAAIVRKGKVELYYSVAHVQKGANPEWQQVAVHRAVSADGRGEFEEDNLPILVRDSNGWTSGEVLAPSLLADDGLIKIWYGGHVRNNDLGPLIQRGFSGPEFGIGYATIADTKLR